MFDQQLLPACVVADRLADFDRIEKLLAGCDGYLMNIVNVLIQLRYRLALLLTGCRNLLVKAIAFDNARRDSLKCFGTGGHLLDAADRLALALFNGFDHPSGALL